MKIDGKHFSHCQVDHFSHFGSWFKVASILQIWQRHRVTPAARSSDQFVLGLGEQNNLTTAKPRSRVDNTGADITCTRGRQAHPRAHARAKPHSHTQKSMRTRARMSAQRFRSHAGAWQCACPRVLAWRGASVPRIERNSRQKQVSTRIAFSLEKCPGLNSNAQV